MIRSFRHRGLKRLYERGDRSGIHPNWIPRVRSILALLESATAPETMNAPGLDLHPLRGDRTGHWSVKVSRNWRITFRFRDGDVYDVNLIDYH